MEPRVFISSTFYDLKYVREEIGSFVSRYGFQPLRSEVGDIGYEHGKDLDESCYKAMRHSDLAILIIGGRYGSPTSIDKEKVDEFDEYISVTRQEFNTAVSSNIPIFIFVEEGVLAEYRLYQKNKEKFKVAANLVSFVSVDHINVLRFIDSIYNLSTYAVTPFKTVDDIKTNLTKQWADMFWKYLRELKNGAQKEYLTPAVNDIYCTIQSMQKMVQKIGESIIGNETQEYESVVNEQMIEMAANRIADTYSFVSSLEDEKSIEEYLYFFIEQLIKVFDDGYIDYSFSSNTKDIEVFLSSFEHDDVVLVEVRNRFKYENEVFDILKKNKTSIVKRLMNTDYLKKMGLILKNY